MSMGTEEKQEAGREIYKKMAQEVPAREVEKEEGTSTLEEKEAEDPGLSDLQVTLRKLFPELGDKIHNALMMARIAPDMFIPILRILVNSAIKKMDRFKPLDVAEKASLFYVLASIGLDGKGRIDTIELAGSVTEAEELKELTKGLGI